MALVKHFKKQLGVTLMKLTSEKYTVKNTWNKQKLAEYIQTMAQYIKKANIDIIYNQLILVYKYIALKL